MPQLCLTLCSFFFALSFLPLDLFLLFFYLPDSKRIDETKSFPSAMATVLLCLSNLVWPLIIAKGGLVFFLYNLLVIWLCQVKAHILLHRIKAAYFKQNIHKILFFYIKDEQEMEEQNRWMTWMSLKKKKKKSLLPGKIITLFNLMSCSSQMLFLIPSDGIKMRQIHNVNILLCNAKICIEFMD